jgi:hypothetical protein
MTLITDGAVGELMVGQGVGIDPVFQDVGTCVDHDSTAGFEANEHIDHTGVFIGTAVGSGLSGGGSIFMSRQLSLDLGQVPPTVYIDVSDRMVFYDVSSMTDRSITVTNLATVLTPLIRQEYVDRGDPSDFDFDVADFTFDSTWRTLDLSGIVPADAVAVDISCAFRTTVAGYTFYFRKPGNSNYHNGLRQQTQVGNMPIEMNGIVSCNSSREIEYFGSSAATYDLANFVVKGWII